MTAPVAPAVPVRSVEDDGVAGPRGLAYQCTTCGVYGFTRSGERKTCWCCGSGEHVSGR